MTLGPAERVLRELGITTPEEIDVQAIALYLGAYVRYRPLDGYEARIVGRGDEAIITINDHGPYRRKRFSIAHELGHWQFHRGKSLVCRVDEMSQVHSALSPERIADNFAANLLMPNYLFLPVARKYSGLSFTAINEIGELFQTGQTATAIRLVESDQFAALLICHGKQGRKWFIRAPSVPDRWFPREELDPESFAFDVLYGHASANPMQHKIGADAWFDRWDAERFEVREQTSRVGNDILTLILVSDSRMLADECS